MGYSIYECSELPEIDPYEEIAQQGHASPLSPAYVPDPIELEHHIPVYVLEPVYPKYYMMMRRIRRRKSSDDDEEDDEQLAPVVALSAVDPVPSSEETEPFETNESADTPPPPPPPVNHTTFRMSVRT
ncbi:hypothetical protein Tco_0028883 [Tanacetum coccineum]